MKKLYIRLALLYAIIAMVFGVFYREFTKFSSFTGKTSLSVLHTHYFMLGMFFFIVLLLLEQQFEFSVHKQIKKSIITYQIGLNITGAALLARGITQIKCAQCANTIDASISGIAGIGHIILGISLVLILLQVKRSVK